MEMQRGKGKLAVAALEMRHGRGKRVEDELGIPHGRGKQEAVVLEMQHGNGAEADKQIRHGRERQSKTSEVLCESKFLVVESWPLTGDLAQSSDARCHQPDSSRFDREHAFYTVYLDHLVIDLLSYSLLHSIANSTPSPAVATHSLLSWLDVSIYHSFDELFRAITCVRSINGRSAMGCMAPKSKSCV